VLFVAFLLSLLAPAGLPRDPADPLRRAFLPFHWGLMGLVLMHVFSNPNLSSLVLWLQIGAVLSLQAALRKERRIAREPSSELATA
jgi:hypothetical protein